MKARNGMVALKLNSDDAKIFFNDPTEVTGRKTDTVRKVTTLSHQTVRCVRCISVRSLRATKLLEIKVFSLYQKLISVRLSDCPQNVADLLRSGFIFNLSENCCCYGD